MLVFTLQNLHPRVHVSPMSMIVAVAALLSDPPQQSLMFGHRASSQTVCRLSPRRSRFMDLYCSLFGMGVWSQEGRRVISFCLPAGPTKAVRISGTSFSGGEDVKSENEGPALRRSRKVVGGRRVVEVGGAAGSVGSETAVANGRVDDVAGRIGCVGTACKQRNRVTLEAMLYAMLIIENN